MAGHVLFAVGEKLEHASKQKCVVLEAPNAKLPGKMEQYTVQFEDGKVVHGERAYLLRRPK